MYSKSVTILCMSVEIWSTLSASNEAVNYLRDSINLAKPFSIDGLIQLIDNDKKNKTINFLIK
mgnify:CR=1 FL=1